MEDWVWAITNLSDGTGATGHCQYISQQYAENPTHSQSLLLAFSVKRCKAVNVVLIWGPSCMSLKSFREDAYLGNQNIPSPMPEERAFIQMLSKNNLAKKQMTLLSFENFYKSTIIYYFCIKRLVNNIYNE